MTLKGKHILIVEDNLQNRVVFQMCLMREGALIEFERWGRDTLFRLKTMRLVDLIVLDLMLADGITGFELFDEIRAIPEFAATPIVAVSAMDPSIAIPKTRAQGFGGFIAKPIDTQIFAKQLTSIIEGESVWYTGEQYA